MTLRLSNSTARRIIDLDIDLYDIVNDYPVSGLLPGESVLICEMYEELAANNHLDCEDDADEILNLLFDMIQEEYDFA
jgi:hypothetical protein